MPSVLVDTNIIVDHLRDFKPATDYLLERRRKDTLWISLISVAEIYAGKRMVEESVQQSVKRFLRFFRVAYLNNRIAIEAGKYVRDVGTIALPDALIAATAVTKNFTLATRNVGHFRAIEGLRIEKPF